MILAYPFPVSTPGGMLHRLPKDLRSYVKAAKKQGWRVEARKRNTWLYSPDRVTTVSIPFSTGDNRTVQNVISELRRADVHC